MFDLPLNPNTPLEGSLDVDAIVKKIPRHYTVKGLFCARFTELLGSEFEGLIPLLSAPPRGDRYLPFKDYPQADYARIVAAAAAKRFPANSLREAVRRIARDDLTTFATSVFGKIVLSLAGDARNTLLRVPDALMRVAPGPNVRSEDVDPHTTRISFEGHRGMVEYTLGQLEGIVLSYRHVPTITIRSVGAGALTFDVVHGG